MSPASATPRRPGRARNVPVTWAARVESAMTPHEVVEVARDFLAQFTPYEVHALPEACKVPAKIVDADDVAAYALGLVRHECGEGPDGSAIERKMADFFSHAAARLARLATDAPLAPAS